MAVTTRDYIHRYLPATKAQMPTLLMLHGTGGNEESLLPIGSQIAPGAALLSPRGKILEGGNPRFFRRKAEGIFDMEDLIFRTHELANWIEAAIIEYGIERQSLIAVGYSNGANIAASIMLLRPEVFRNAVLLRPMLPLKPEKAPNLADTRVLIEAGRFDAMIPQLQTEQLAQVLREYGSQVTMQWHSTGHQLIQPDLIDARHWIERTNAHIQTALQPR